MQFFRHIFSKNTYLALNLSKEVILALIIVVLPIFYPKTVHASFFSAIFGDIAGDQASAKALDTSDTLNSQNMPVLKAVINPSNVISDVQPVIISQNSLSAEIGPSGTISEIEDPVNTQISLYTVRKGDTLSEISHMFEVSVNTIIWANSLGRNPILREGQNLIILPITGIRHIVKKGETIKGIVQKYKADLNEVMLDNDISINSVLNEGDTIIIPDAEPTVETQVSGVKTQRTTARLHDANGPSYPGYYMRPIVGGRKSQGLHGYNGIDLAASVGTPIYASAGGTVIASMTNGGWNGGYGNYVIISHSNGTQTLYAHNSVNLVSIGQYVDRGDMIARIGMTGKTTGPHVHFEIRGAKNPF